MKQGFLGILIGCFLWGCGDAKKTDSEEDVSIDSDDISESELEEYRLDNYAADLGSAYTMSSMQFGEDTNHTLTVYMFERHTSADVHAPDRGMTRFVFFWNNEQMAVQSIELGAEYSYNYWWEGERYDVSFEIIDAEFTKTEFSFELNGKTDSVSELRAGVVGMSSSEMEHNACRFNRDLLRFAWESIEQRIGDGECWTLIDESLRASGAHYAEHYRFGSFVTQGSATEEADFSRIMAGDIIQFDQAYFEGTDGSWSWAGEPNHTAMIRSVDIEQNHITVYEQNSPVGGPTKIGGYFLSQLQEGGFYIYRAVPIENSPEVLHCDTPLGILHAYETAIETGFDGELLGDLALENLTGDALETCQITCDDMSTCTGFVLDEMRCEFFGEGAEVSQSNMAWYKKIR